MESLRGVVKLKEGGHKGYALGCYIECPGPLCLPLLPGHDEMSNLALPCPSTCLLTVRNTAGSEASYEQRLLNP